jgi:hypothetical protein
MANSANSLIVLLQNVGVPMWAFLLVGLGVPISSIVNTFLTQRAASRAAKLVAGVKNHLETSEKKTDVKLDKIHYLVNNNLSEQFKQKLYMAQLLVGLQRCGRRRRGRVAVRRGDDRHGVFLPARLLGGAGG